MMVVAALVTFLSIAALITSQFGRYAGRQAGDSELLAAADSGLEYLYAQWQAAAASGFTKATFAPSADVYNHLDSTLLSNLNSTNLPFNAAGITFTTAQIRLVNPDGSLADTGSNPATFTNISVPAYPGWNGHSYNYQAKVTVAPSASKYHFGFSGGVTAPSGTTPASTPPASVPTITLTRSMNSVQVPLFQAAIFYENKLEIHPGAAMTISGLVHTNGDLWARGFDQLLFKNNVSYVGSYHPTGDSTVTKGWDGYGYGLIPGVTSGYTNIPLPTWSASQNSQLSQVSPIDPFGGTNSSDNALHQIIQVPQTAADKANPIFVYNSASIIITVNSAPGTPVASQVTVTDGAGNALSGPDAALVRNAITVGSGNTFFDAREGNYMTATTLDMSKLAVATVPKVGVTSLTGLQSIFASGSTDPNTTGTLASGTVYIRDVSTATSTEPAIRLINGANLGENVTVASSNPVYIQGDYNTGVATSANPVPSNVSNDNGSATPQINGYTRYSSAVMADAVTILSNSWNDNNSTATLTSRNATPTTVNTAIMAGDIPSNYNGNKTASGGAHNFPRFLENWDNVNFTYWGSLVEAYRSTAAHGLWQTGQVYYWPNRKWNFDVNFLNQPPPGYSSGTQYIRGNWIRTNS